ncbi:MAG: Tex-like N-terminal domain-containing protein, partial [Bacteroidota bacterium]
MNEKHVSILSKELGISAKQIKSVILLFDQGATIPFVARYRKEVTGGLDEEQLTNIRDRKEKLEEIDKRRESILHSMRENEQLTPELEKQLLEAQTLTELEDIYLPFRPKRKTRASIAREKGLEPLAKILMSQRRDDMEKAAAQYIDSNKGVESIADALAGARDIIAEW